MAVAGFLESQGCCSLMAKYFLVSSITFAVVYFSRCMDTLWLFDSLASAFVLSICTFILARLLCWDVKLLWNG